MKEIRSLTALRGIFAMWVLGYHLRSLHPVPIPDPFGLMLRGYLGADFFFLLSGFVLAGAYGDKVLTLTGYLRFAVKRVRRLVPLHLVVLAIVAPVMATFGSWPGTRQLVIEAALIHRLPGVMTSNNAFNGPDWSISTELLVNLLLMPLIVATMLRGTNWITKAAMSVLYAVLVWICLSTDGTLDHSSANSWLPILRCFCEFSIGTALYRWREWGARISEVGALTLTIVAAIGRLSDALMVPLFAVTILSISAEAGFASRLLRWRPLHWLGEISFSVYLVHLPVLYAVRQGVIWAHASVGIGLLLYVVGTIAGTVSLSAIAYPVIEERFRRPFQRRARGYQKMVSSAS